MTDGATTVGPTMTDGATTADGPTVVNGLTEVDGPTIGPTTGPTMRKTPRVLMHRLKLTKNWMHFLLPKGRQGTFLWQHGEECEDAATVGSETSELRPVSLAETRLPDNANVPRQRTRPKWQARLNVLLNLLSEYCEDSEDEIMEECFTSAEIKIRGSKGRKRKQPANGGTVIINTEGRKNSLKRHMASKNC